MKLWRPLFPPRAEFCYFKNDDSTSGLEQRATGQAPARQVSTGAPNLGLNTNVGSITLPKAVDFGREDTSARYTDASRTPQDLRTERLARAAQRINNRIYLGGGNFSRGDASYGPGGAFTPGTVDKPEDISKPGGITTEDMAQQAEERALRMSKRGYNELDLIKDTANFAREIDKLKVQGNIEGAIKEAESRIDMAIRNNDTRLLMAYLNHMSQVGLNVTGSILNKVTKYVNDPAHQYEVKGWMGQLPGMQSMPEWYNESGDALNRQGLHQRDEIYRWMLGASPLTPTGYYQQQNPAAYHPVPPASSRTK